MNKIYQLISFKKGIRFIKRSICVAMIVPLLLLNAPIVLADVDAISTQSQPIVSEELTRGAQEPTGVQEPTGPQGPTGVQANYIELTSQNELSNELTGPSSENINDLASSNIVSETTENSADIDNTVEASLNTGDNQIGQNSIVGNVNTGDINGTVSILNVGNSSLDPNSTINTQTIDGSSTNKILLSKPENESLLNLVTGPDSENQNYVSDENIILVTENNDADTDNLIDINANTGRNQIENNTQVGTITTGDINLGTNLINILNSFPPELLLTLDIWNILGDYNGDIIIDNLNDLTGPDSNNNNEIQDVDSLSVSIDQNADVTNSLSLNTDTGNNQIGSNSVVDGVITGDTWVKNNEVNLLNIAEVPIFYIFNVFGQWSGELLGIDPSRVFINQENSLTGPGSDNNNELLGETQVTQEVNNNATANNLITINANTGNNTVNNNTVVGQIKTGSIKVSNNVINVMNSFGSQVGRFTLGIINIFGNWKGNVADDEVCTQNCGGGASDNKKNHKKKKIVTTLLTSQEIITEVTQIEEIVPTAIARLKKPTLSFFVPDGKGSFENEDFIESETGDNEREPLIFASTDNSDPASFFNQFLIVTSLLFILFTVLWLKLRAKEMRSLQAKENIKRFSTK